MWLVVVIAIVVIAAGGVWYFKQGNNNAPQYQTAPVTRGDVVQVVSANGTLNPVTNITVGSQVSGIILKLNADWNSPVKAGQVLAQIDPATYESSLRSALADLANTAANLELQQVQARRSSELFTNKLISGSDYDTALVGLHQAQAQIQIKQAAVTNALVNLQRCTIYSPVDGTVISRAVDIGQTVAASLSAPTMFVIANDLTKMQIDANVSEADIGAVLEGQDVNFSVDAFPDSRFTGRVRQVRNSPTTVQNVVTYDTVIDVGNPELKLRPGMTANASIVIAQRPNVIKIPNAAFRFRPPEQPTNTSLFARFFGGGGTKPPSTNATPAIATGISGTNNAEVASGGEAPLTGSESPEELQRRVTEMRGRGEDIPPEIMAKLRDYYQSGVLQRPARGGGPGGPGGGGGLGGFGGRGGGGRGSQPAMRTVYIMPTNSASASPVPQAVRIRTGINDGSNTEITSGLNEGDTVVIGLKFPQTTSTTPTPGGQPSPFGGGGRGRGF